MHSSGTVDTTFRLNTLNAFRNLANDAGNFTVVVVVYAGENDIAEGASPQEVLERFTAFVQTVKADLPNSSRFSPVQTPLAELLRVVKAHAPNRSRE